MQPDRSVHYPSVLQLLISGFGLMLFGASAAGLFFLAVMSLMGNGPVFVDVFPLFAAAWTSLAVAALLLPSLVLAVLRLFGREDRWRPMRAPLRLASLLMLAWPLLIAAGHFAAEIDQLGIFLVPPIQVLAIAIPLWWFFELGRRRLRRNHSQRNWGVLSGSLVITPVVVIVIELALLLVLVIAAIVWVSSQPQLTEELNRLAQRLANANMDPEATLRILRPYLQQPLVLYAGFAIAAGLIPLIEELFKPLAVWALASFRFTPADGFVAGMISGAGFALVESLGMLTSVGAVEWAASVAARMGTGLLHVLTAGLVGYGLASAWSRARYGRLAGAFLLAFLLHGVWNFFGVLVGIAPVFEEAGVVVTTGVLAVAARYAPAALVALGVVMFLILLGMNRKLQSDEQEAPLRNL